VESMKILVVDDEAPIRDMLQKGLSQRGGFSVEVAQNGVEAIEKTEKEQSGYRDLVGFSFRPLFSDSRRCGRFGGYRGLPRQAEPQHCSNCTSYDEGVDSSRKRLFRHLCRWKPHGFRELSA
jgi:CheY-like chemotaxis protein